MTSPFNGRLGAACQHFNIEEAIVNIAIFIYEDAEVLDFAGPFEVFATANRLSNAKDSFNVFLVAQAKAPVMARAGFSVNPHYDFSNHPNIDVLIVAGGIHDRELDKSCVIDWVNKVAANAQYVTSVCTGAFILAKAGLLSKRNVTTHWQDIDELERSFPMVTVVKSRRWVEDGKLVTSGGISAGIDMSLYLVSSLEGVDLARLTAKQMEYEWNRDA